MRTVVGIVILLWAADASAQRWQDATQKCIGITGEGKAPYHKVVYDDGDGNEQAFVFHFSVLLSSVAQ